MDKCWIHHDKDAVATSKNGFPVCPECKKVDDETVLVAGALKKKKKPKEQG